MIEINLLPEEAKKKKRSAPKISVSAIKLPSPSIIGFAAAAAGIVLIAHLALVAIGFMKDANLKSLKREYKGALPEKHQTEELKLQLDIINEKVITIDELMVKRFSWKKNLDSLSDSMTAGIWLTELEYDEKLIDALKMKTDIHPKPVKDKQIAEKIVSKYLILSGSAYSKGEEGAALIGRFMKSLKDNPEFYSDFSNIELGTIKADKMNDQDIMTFKITCFFKAR